MPSELDYFLDSLSESLDVADALDFPFHHFSLHFKHSSGRMLHQTCSVPSDIPARVAAMPGWDAYICPQPHKILGKPTLSDIKHVYWAVLDIDPLTDAHMNLDTCAALKTQLQIVLSKDIDPVVVLTGRGTQFWIPISPTSGRILRDLQYTLDQCGFFRTLNILGWAIDPTCFEASHIFRIPESLNTKTGTQAFIWQSPKSYIPLVLSDYLLTAPTPNPPAPRGQEPPHNLGSILTSVSPQARDFLAFGAKAPQSRHRQAFIACAQLKELGVPLDTARPLVQSAAAACTPPLTDWEDVLVRTYARNSEST